MLFWFAFSPCDVAHHHQFIIISIVRVVNDRHVVEGGINSTSTAQGAFNGRRRSKK